MGVDFIEKATPSFKKSWDRQRVVLSTAGLFTRTPDCVARTVAADVTDNGMLAIGDRLTVETQDGALIVRQGNREVARISDPPQEIRQAVVDSCGIAKGTVQQIHKIAGVLEISLC